MQSDNETGHFWEAHTVLRKWSARWTTEQVLSGEAGEPDDGIEESDGNMLCTPGILLMLKALRGDAPIYFSAANARLGVGDSTTAATAVQTDLQAASNKVRVAMDTGWPKVGVADGLADNQIQLQATFASGIAEWGTGWQEWGWFNAASAGTMMNRKVENKGVKGASTTWQFQTLVTIT